MKRKSLFFMFTIAYMFWAINISAQSSLPGYYELSSILDGDDMASLAEAEGSIMEAETMVSNADAAFAKFAKYFAKKNKKKAEKKSAPAKLLRIQAYKKYEEGYTQAFEVYKSALEDVNFDYQDIGNKSALSRSEAENQFLAAQNIMDNCKKQTLKTLQTYQNDKLNRELNAAKEQYEKALQKLAETGTMLQEEKQRKKEEQAEDEMWQKAVADNTIDAYQEYVSKYPRGKYVTTAKSIITQMEEDARQSALIAAQTSSVKFRVQIAASQTVLDPSKLSIIYSGRDKVRNEEYPRENYRYKYTLGEFDKYEDAKNYKARINVAGSFIVAYKEGDRIHIKEALKEIKQ